MGGGNFAVKKSGKISPLAKFFWCVTNSFTMGVSTGWNPAINNTHAMPEGRDKDVFVCNICLHLKKCGVLDGHALRIIDASKKRHAHPCHLQLQDLGQQISGAIARNGWVKRVHRCLDLWRMQPRTMVSQ